MTRSDGVEFPLIAQGQRDPVYLRIRSLHQMQASEQQVNVSIKRAGRFQDLFHSGMGTPIHEDQTARGFYGERELPQF